MSFDAHAAGHLISRDRPLAVDAFGPTVEILTVQDPDAPGLLRGTMPPGVVVPMHAHADPETFYVLSGRMEGLVVTPDRTEWVTVEPGQVFHVPPNARHALRNVGGEPNVALIISTARMAEFFERIGTSLPSLDAPRRPPTLDDLTRFATVSDRFGYWNASPEENAEVGIDVPAPPSL